MIKSEPKDEPPRGRPTRGEAKGGREDVDAPVPSRQQYLDLKRGYPHAILLFRMGDFYETFDDDARVVARDLRITLTSRTFGRSGRVPMAGIPHHALNHYLSRLLGAGHTVAIAEQLSEPGKGLVERAITRVLTPGTIGEAALLPASENRYLAAVLPRPDRIGLGWVDVSTGEFGVVELSGPGAGVQLGEELVRLNPAECLIPDDFTPDQLPPGVALVGHLTRLEHWHFEAERAQATLGRQFGTHSLEAYGCADLPGALGAAGAILAYLGHTNPALLPLLTGLRTEIARDRVGLDLATRRNLELTRGLRSGGSRGSLLGVLDETRTAMGSRALRRLIGQPRTDLEELLRRQSIVAALVDRPETRARLAALLSAVGDLERLTSRVTQGIASARDYLSLASGLRTVAVLGADLAAAQESVLPDLAATLDVCADVLAEVTSAVVEDDAGVARIRPGYWPGLDDALARVADTRSWLGGLERRERERTGIRSLKVGFNKVFGYYIEVTRSNLALVPGEYQRKQTIAGGERFVTVPLKEAEARILAADEAIAELERAALAALGARVTTAAARLLATASQVAMLDASLALTEVAARNKWVQPTLDRSDTLEIDGGRHPVVEATLGGEAFIPNDCFLGGDHPRLLVVTGPNMGGKSTYLRQCALIVLLAQIGSFVPAARARIGLVDRIFTRVGAQDDLAGGASTFMVEMLETATILHQATRRSLVIFDEVGRGTSTHDGLAIARAVLEDMYGRVGARTLFATHFRELTALAEEFSDLANVHVAALESDGRVIFLYAVRPGAADRAYGIQVARLAGLPPWVAARAEILLADLQRAGYDTAQLPPAPSNHPRVAEGGAAYQLAFDGFGPQPNAAERLARELQSLDLSQMTPRQAIDWLFGQQERLKGGN